MVLPVCTVENPSQDTIIHSVVFLDVYYIYIPVWELRDPHSLICGPQRQPHPNHRYHRPTHVRVIPKFEKTNWVMGILKPTIFLRIVDTSIWEYSTLFLTFFVELIILAQKILLASLQIYPVCQMKLPEWHLMCVYVCGGAVLYFYEFRVFIYIYMYIKTHTEGLCSLVLWECTD